MPAGILVSLRRFMRAGGALYNQMYGRKRPRYRKLEMPVQTYRVFIGFCHFKMNAFFSASAGSS